MTTYSLTRKKESFHLSIQLASSKSESNRALILHALTDFKSKIENVSSARDTQTLIRLLDSDDQEANVIDAGTTMRFLTAYFALTNQTKTMTGTARMCERPIALLVDALRSIGAEIHYLGLDGFPPLSIQGFREQQNDLIEIRGDVSSQYISALLMLAPTLPNGLRIRLLGEVGSVPYITMTIQQMAAFGVEVNWDKNENILSVLPQKYIPITYQIESDWSGASYWYSILALDNHPESTVELIGLKANSLQGDSAIVAIMEQLGVKTEYTEKGVLLTKGEVSNNFEWDFTNCPDLAQTIAVIVVALGIPSVFTGIESLKIKETDRVAALQNELAKIGGVFIEEIPATKYTLSRKIDVEVTNPVFETYDDHRMAMAFAPLALLYPVQVKEPHVVVKSYPSYWDDLQQIVEIK